MCASAPRVRQLGRGYQVFPPCVESAAPVVHQMTVRTGLGASKVVVWHLFALKRYRESAHVGGCLRREDAEHKYL